MSKISQVALLALLMPFTLHAQQDDDFIHRQFQFTFMVPPLSTNGVDFHRTVNCASINTFAGVSAGTECLELGGFININRAYMRGTQLSGFVNIVGTFSGEGFSSEGFQAAGFGNFTNNSFSGVQAAGFANINARSIEGLQAGGFANINNLSKHSLQAAGFTNIGRRVDSTLQLAGFANIALEGEAASQASGFMNVGRNIEGFQIGGFANIAGDVKGVQMAGFLNYCDSITGIPIGFINIVKKNGFRRFEISASEFAWLQLSYKMGVDRFYNIYALGKPLGGFNRYIMGAGIGTRLPLDETYTLNLEAIAHQELMMGEETTFSFFTTNRLNMVNQLRAIFSRSISQDISVFLAPTFNVGIASDNGHDNHITDDLMPYWRINPVSWRKNRVRLWFGFSTGFSI